MILAIGALLGLVSVAFGAYAEHGLRSGLTEESFRSVMTAIRYNQVHAVALVAIGIGLLQPAASAWGTALAWSAWLFVVGTVLFSFTIYLSAVLGMSSLLRVAPLGGLVLMAGWLTLVWAGIRAASA